jgi:hypothetical protein
MTYVCKQKQHVLISHYLCREQDTKGSLFITWRQRISKTAKPVGTGYFMQVQYTRNKDGLIQKALERFRHSKKKQEG